MVIAPLPRARHLEVRITDLSDMTQKTKVPYHGRYWHAKELAATALSDKCRSEFVVLHLQLVTTQYE